MGSRGQATSLAHMLAARAIDKDAQVSNSQRIDTERLRAVLESVWGADGAPLLDEGVHDIDQEGSWLAITLGSSAVSRSRLADVHDIVREQCPGQDIEIRSGNVIHRGGTGFGEGRHIVVILGGKGGVGKSTIAVNLAITLAAMDQRVGLLDGDLNAPDLHHLLGISAPEGVSNDQWDLWRTSVLPPSGWLRPVARYGMEVASIGLTFADTMAPTISGRETIAALLRRLVFETSWSANILVIDAPPGTGEEVQVMLGQLPISAALMVTTPQDLAQMDAGRTVSLLRSSGIPVIGMVQNMAYLPCPHCSKTIDLFSGSARLEDEGVPVLGQIPFDTRLSEGADQGTPLVLGDRQRSISLEFARIAAQTRAWLRAIPATS